MSCECPAFTGRFHEMIKQRNKYYQEDYGAIFVLDQLILSNPQLASNLEVFCNVKNHLLLLMSFFALVGEF